MERSRDESAHQAGCNPETHEPQGRTRREFAKTLAALAVTPLLRPALAPVLAEDLPPATTGDPLAMIPSGAQAQTPDKPLPEAEALAEVARIQYGKNLTDDQMTEIKRSLSGRFRAAEAMKKIKLANGDEPAFIFSASP